MSPSSRASRKICGSFKTVEEQVEIRRAINHTPCSSSGPSSPLCSLVPELPLGFQPLVEAAELPQEAVVGSDLPFLTNHGQGGAHVQVLAKHQEGDDQRGRAAVAFPAVNVHFAYRAKSYVSFYFIFF